MTESEITSVEELYKADPGNFSCSECKHVLHISSYRGCPIYCQSFDPD